MSEIKREELVLKDVVNVTSSFLLPWHCKLVAFVLKPARWLPPHHHVVFQAERVKKGDDVERQNPPYKTWPFIWEGKLFIGTSYISLASRVQHGYF